MKKKSSPPKKPTSDQQLERRREDQNIILGEKSKMEKTQIKTRIEFMSISLWEKFNSYLAEHADNQTDGMAVNYGIVKHTGPIYLSNLPPFLILQKLCHDFKQVVKPSIQWGDMCLVNESNGKSNNDTPIAPALTHKRTRCWYNVNVSTRISGLSQSF